MTENSDRRRRYAEFTLAALGLLAVVVCLPVIQSGTRWGFWDWDIFEAAIEVARKSIVEYGQAPAWNPYLAGGHSLTTHSLLPLASPSFLGVLLFGTIPGIKLWIVVRQFVMLGGAYLLARRLSLGRPGAWTVAILFGLSSGYAQRVAHGHWNLQAFVFLPLLIFAGLEAVRPDRPRRRAIALAGGLLALMFLDGGPYTLLMGVLGLLVPAAVGFRRRHWRHTVTGLAGVAALALSLSAVKGIPLIEASDELRAPHLSTPGDFYDPSFSPTLGEFLHAALLDRAQSSRPGRFATFHINVGSYVGPLGLALILLGGLGTPLGRRALLFALPVLWVCLGSSAPINLWEALLGLPIVNRMAVPSKFTPGYMLALAVAGGAGIELLRRQLADRRYLKWLPIALLAGLALDLFFVSQPLFRHAFPIEAIPVERVPFHQRLESPFAQDYIDRVTLPLGSRPFWEERVYSPSSNFPAVRAGFGVLGTLTGAREQAVMGARPDPGGQFSIGQVSAVAGEEPRLIEWSPNLIRVRVDPARGGKLALNQNFHEGWRARSGERTLQVIPTLRQALAVELEPGLSEITLSFETPSRRLGAWVSLLAAGVGLAMLAPTRRKKGPTAG
ncbi:MAG: hypothetical protein HRU00_00255 [Myxococcales bacterium]|nr:hypothetical protein [Myxococcales bacterium]